MELRIGNINSFDCLGVVTILTRDRVIFQGEIVGRSPGVGLDFFPPLSINSGARVPFLLLELNCFPALLRDNAEIKVINPPLYQPNNTIRINLEEIVSIGPSGACFEEEST